MTTKLEPSSDEYSLYYCVTLTEKKMKKVNLHNRAAVTLIALAAKEQTYLISLHFHHPLQSDRVIGPVQIPIIILWHFPESKLLRHPAYLKIQNIIYQTVSTKARPALTEIKTFLNTLSSVSIQRAANDRYASSITLKFEFCFQSLISGSSAVKKSSWSSYTLHYTFVPGHWCVSFSRVEP